MKPMRLHTEPDTKAANTKSDSGMHPKGGSSDAKPADMSAIFSQSAKAPSAGETVSIGDADSEFGNLECDLADASGASCIKAIVTAMSDMANQTSYDDMLFGLANMSIDVDAITLAKEELRTTIDELMQASPSNSSDESNGGTIEPVTLAAFGDLVDAPEQWLRDQTAQVHANLVNAFGNFEIPKLPTELNGEQLKSAFDGMTSSLGDVMQNPMMEALKYLSTDGLVAAVMAYIEPRASGDDIVSSESLLSGWMVAIPADLKENIIEFGKNMTHGARRRQLGFWRDHWDSATSRNAESDDCWAPVFKAPSGSCPPAYYTDDNLGPAVIFSFDIGEIFRRFASQNYQLKHYLKLRLLGGKENSIDATFFQFAIKLVVPFDAFSPMSASTPYVSLAVTPLSAAVKISGRPFDRWRRRRSSSGNFGDDCVESAECDSKCCGMRREVLDIDDPNFRYTEPGDELTQRHRQKTCVRTDEETFPRTYSLPDAVERFRVSHNNRRRSTSALGVTVANAANENYCERFDQVFKDLPINGNQRQTAVCPSVLAHHRLRHNAIFTSTKKITTR